MNVRTDSEPKLLFQGLAGFYAAVSDHWYPMIRIVFAACVMTHGWPKLMSGAAAVAPGMAKMGFVPGIAFAYAAMVLEIVGASCVALGLFTRIIGKEL
jgi:uncharacterized membrane protein YphA (DoxX/SURF4 family)